MVAELRHEEALGAVSRPVLLGEAVVAAVRRVDLRVLDVAVRARGSARPRCGSRRARAGRRSPPCRRERSCRSRCTCRRRSPSPTSGRWSCSWGRPPARPRTTASNASWAAPVSSSRCVPRARKSRRSVFTASWPPRRPCPGGAATWQVVHTSSPACSARSFCGKPAGRATFAWWQRTQSTRGVGLLRLLLRGIPGVRRERTVASLAADAPRGRRPSPPRPRRRDSRGRPPARRTRPDGRERRRAPPPDSGRSGRSPPGSAATAARRRPRCRPGTAPRRVPGAPGARRSVPSPPPPGLGLESVQAPRSACIVRKIRGRAKKRTAHGERIKLTTAAPSFTRTEACPKLWSGFRP